MNNVPEVNGYDEEDSAIEGPKKWNYYYEEDEEDTDDRLPNEE